MKYIVPKVRSSAFVSLVAVAVLVALVAVAHAADERFAALDGRMEQYVDDGEIAGAVTLVGEGGQIVHLEAVGLADIERQTPMADDTLFGVMSMTKPITATAVMILVDEGKLAVDDPVEKYLPAFAGAETAGGEKVRGLTIRRLLTHTSGLVGDQACVESLAATADMLAARPFGFQPDARWEYGPSLNVCGRIIEVVAGQPYEEFLAERIFRPLAMDDTTFHLTPAQRSRTAALYRRRVRGRDRSLVPADRWGDVGEPGCVPNPSGGLFATADNMFRFYQMILAGGELNGRRIVSEAAVRQMTMLQSGDHATGFTPGNGWGLGWCIVRQPQGVTAAVSPGTFGHGGAFGTQGWVDPVRERVFVLMIQRSDIGNADGSEIRRDFQNLAAEALDAD